LNGTNDPFSAVTEVGNVGTWAGSRDRLYTFDRRQDGWHFIPAASDIQLELTYYSNGVPPNSGEIGIPDCDLYLSHLTAAWAGPSKGLEDRGRQLMNYFEAEEGPKDLFIRGLVQAQAGRRIQSARFDAGETLSYNAGQGARPPLFG